MGSFEKQLKHFFKKGAKIVGESCKKGWHKLIPSSTLMEPSSNVEEMVQPSASFNAEFNGYKYSDPSDLVLAISLELLSCIQPEQIISIQRICDVVMPALLHYLSTRNRITNVDDTSHVEDDIEATRKNFEPIKQWEKDLDRLIKDLLGSDWDFSGITAGNARDCRKLYEVSNAISIKPADDDRGQSSSSNFSSTKEESWDQSSRTKFPEIVPSYDFDQAGYDSLNHQLQKCLLYLSAFPANSKIRKKALTCMWIGEGFINPTAADGLSSEEIAEKYFQELVTKGFIQPVDEKDSGDFSSCKMNSSIHSAVLQRAKNSNLFDFDDRDKPTTNYINSGRACLTRTEAGSLEQFVNSDDKSNRNKLYTILNIDETFPEFPAGWLSKRKNVQTLCLGSWQSSSMTAFLVDNAEFLKDLGDLKLLRCLSLNRVYNIKKLPKSICKLDHLIILDLKACHDLQELPDAIESLENLTLLDMSECHLIDYMPKGLCKLVKLLVLKGFVISGDHTTSKSQCSLADLVKLEKLRKLSIYTNRNVTGNVGQQLTSLSEFKALQVLTISWIRVPSPAPPRMLAFLETLLKGKRHDNVSSLPASLEKLDLRCWPFPEMPRWVNPLELQKLKKLYIRGGSLSHLHQEMTVKILRLQYLKELEMNWQTAGKLFPNLVYLEKIDCPMLVNFPADEVWKPGMDNC